jgi:hypothetical protein
VGERELGIAESGSIAKLLSTRAFALYFPEESAIRHLLLKQCNAHSITFTEGRTAS